MITDMSRRMYFSRREGAFPNHFDLLGVRYEKVDDLRYGTNPHQAAAFYRAIGRDQVLGSYRLLKSGKSGLSETNLEDMDRALRIVKYCAGPAAAVMKHVNPSGAAVGNESETLRDVYRRARDCNRQAAFGSTVAVNRPLDGETAEEIMTTVVECVVAPGYSDDARAVLESGAERGRNRDLRVVEISDVAALPLFVGDGPTDGLDVRALDDGSIVLAKPMLTAIRSVDDLILARARDDAGDDIAITRSPRVQEFDDALFAWRVTMHVRSNAMVVVKHGATLAVGTGEQDRIGALEQGIEKHRRKYRGSDSLEGAVLASDGYIPFRDCVEAAAGAGITTIVQPGGSRNDWEVIAACNELGVSMLFTGERTFSHH